MRVRALFSFFLFDILHFALDRGMCGLMGLVRGVCMGTLGCSTSTGTGLYVGRQGMDADRHLVFDELHVQCGGVCVFQEKMPGG